VLVTITSTTTAATDLGFLLHKHPGKVQSFEASVGQAHVFYPEATEARCNHRDHLRRYRQARAVRPDVLSRSGARGPSVRRPSARPGSGQSQR
jgi:hypothetical protein